VKPESAHWTDPVAYLRRALAEDQFTLYCQPIAALSGVVVYPMAEVLVRLREEEAALLPPGEFLPVLEYHGMMPARSLGGARSAAAPLGRAGSTSA
jgi:EAL domain-containing protein (putative c-di-GMP-specific phosphodiesterase class I)